MSSTLPQQTAQPAATPDPAAAFGLKGLWGQIASVGAVGLICLMFYQDRHVTIEQAREDRVVFRAAIDRIGQESEKQSHAIRELAEQVRRLADKR